MMTFLIHLLHIFVITAFSLFVVFAFLALNGTFDHWTERLKQHKRRRFRSRFHKKKPYVQKA
jgi:hypothetical protein